MHKRVDLDKPIEELTVEGKRDSCQIFLNSKKESSIEYESLLLFVLQWSNRIDDFSIFHLDLHKPFSFNPK